MTNSFSKPSPDDITNFFFEDLHAELGACYFNAWHNMTKRYCLLKLKVVIGSLGLAGHFEYGGKKHTTRDFYKNPFDSHAWLEDAEGNVYDYIFPFYEYCARTTGGKNPTFPTDWEILGCSKKDLAEEGLEYIPCPPAARADIIKNVAAHAKAAGLAPWVVKGVANM